MFYGRFYFTMIITSKKLSNFYILLYNINMLACIFKESFYLVFWFACILPIGGLQYNVLVYVYIG